jgi:hypothetical protein
MFDTERKALTNVLNHLVDEICLTTERSQAHYLLHDITCLQEYLETTTREGEKT